jgi:glycosyltransferase involved in cell wall biosynthesis
VKILHVIPTLNKGGAERIALDSCIELQRQGHTVKLVTLHPNNHYAFLTAHLDYNVIQTNVQLSLLRKNRVDVSALQQIITDFQPDVIHSHLFEAEINLAFCVLPPHTKRALHFHDNMIQMHSFSAQLLFNKRKLANFYERKLVLANLPKNTAAIGISDNSFQFVSASLPNKITKYKLLNAIDLHRFYPSEEESVAEGLVMIGSLTTLKGQELAIRTCAELQRRGCSIPLHLIGSGKQLTSLIELSKKLDVAQLVIFHGILDDPETLLKRVRIYIHTSHSEAFGLVLIEAMACGLPVVCTDGKGNRDLIIEGENGFIVWERDPILLADKIQFLLENEAERQRMGVVAHRFAQDFGMENYVKKLVEVYQSN